MVILRANDDITSDNSGRWLVKIHHIEIPDRIFVLKAIDVRNNTVKKISQSTAKKKQEVVAILNDLKGLGLIKETQATFEITHKGELFLKSKAEMLEQKASAFSAIVEEGNERKDLV